MKTNIAPSTLAAFTSHENQARFYKQVDKVADDIIRQTNKHSDATAAEIAQRLYLPNSTVHARLNNIMKAQKNAGYYLFQGRKYRLSYIDCCRISNTVPRTNVRCRTYQMHEIIEH